MLLASQLAWVFYFSLPVSFLLAFGIGANDLANRSVEDSGPPQPCKQSCETYVQDPEQ